MKGRLLSALLIFTALSFSALEINACEVADLKDGRVNSLMSFSDFQEKDFAISPNPATTKLNIKLNRSLMNEQQLELSVYDVLGKKVFQRTDLSALETSIDVSKWNRGIYLVRISSKDSTYTKRFVKQ